MKGMEQASPFPQSCITHKRIAKLWNARYKWQKVAHCSTFFPPAALQPATDGVLSAARRGDPKVQPPTSMPGAAPRGRHSFRFLPRRPLERTRAATAGFARNSAS
eukprot:scaffold7328_cov314-Pinguiococcus_pyrenoidosus.AAC.82